MQVWSGINGGDWGGWGAVLSVLPETAWWHPVIVVATVSPLIGPQM